MYKYRIFTCVQIPHFSVVEILVKHCSLYNKALYSMTVTRKPLDYLQNTFFGKISRSEWVKKASVCSRLFPSLQCNRHLYEIYHEQHRLRSIGKCGFRFWNPDFTYEKSVLRVDFNYGFHGFPFYRLIGKSKQGFAKLFSWTALFFLRLSVRMQDRCS